MMYREVAPHPKLRKHIKCFWALEHDYGHSRHDHEHLWADAHTELIFTSGERYFRDVRGRPVALPASFVVGPFQNELQLFCQGRLTLVAARFWPWGFHSFSQVPMRDVKNAVRSTRSVLGEAADALERATGAEQETDTKLAQLEQALLHRLASVPKPKLRSRPVAIDAIEVHGVTRISELQQRHGIQARRLERIFLDEIGVTPKIFCRIVRFNRAKSIIEQDPDADLRQLAHECGYADQSHFTRNFREMFRRTPAEFKALMQESAKLSRNLKRDVVFLQDEAARPG